MYIEPEILLCPECKGEIIEKGFNYFCSKCGKEILDQDGVINLLPEKLDPVKVNEDKIFQDQGEEYLRIRNKPWLNLFNRQHSLNILRFNDELIDKLPVGRFIELGGETCYISSIYKSEYPQATVYATDVSKNSLRNLAIPTSLSFPHQPDVFAALDAEELPFKDNTFDVVFAMTMIHHLPNPENMLSEVKRILKKSGVFIAIDHCVPAHFKWLFSNAANHRAEKFGIQEDLISYKRWKEIFQLSSFPLESLKVYTNPAYQPNPLIAIFGRLIALIPDTISRHILPVGVQIVFRKE